MEVGERFFAVSPGHPVRADPLREDATRPGCGLRPRPPGTGCGANAVSQGETRLGDGTAGSGTCPVPPHRPRPTRGRIRARPDHSWEPRTHRCVRRAGCGRRTAPRAAGLDTAVGLVDEGYPGSPGSVTVRTPATGTHATPGHRDAQEVRGREPPPDPRMHWLPARCIRVMAGASARRCACLHGAEVSSAPEAIHCRAGHVRITDGEPFPDLPHLPDLPRGRRPSSPWPGGSQRAGTASLHEER